MKVVTVYMTSNLRIALGEPAIVLKRRVFRWSWLARLYAILNTAPPTGGVVMCGVVEDLRNNVTPLRQRQESR